ncbi:N-acetylglucosamine-6-phosphate deacetylase [Aeromonas allosaccharophila]|uniref:N-acetylglucosamine-6-phosphate deacetylase n=1 Tax=Aeromonas allosaccharophila TaxID=656 RepID=UPI00342F941A
MVERIRARHLLTETGWREACWLEHENGWITAIGSLSQENMGFDVELLVPALIDGHVHGGAGIDVMDSDSNVLGTLSMAKAAEGVGAFLATTVTAPLPEIEQTLARIADGVASGMPGAELLGCYLEGPYFTPDNKGAHDQALFRELDVSELNHLQQLARGTLKVVALAPEKPNAITAIRHLAANGVRVMLGHSAADHGTTMAALAAGASGLVHCFNGMQGLHHREPGMVGAGLVHPDAWLELIADGHHVHPSVLKLCHCCAGERLLLITDAMRAAGMPDGHYLLGNYRVEMKEGVVRTEAGGLAGSTLTLLDAVRNMVNLAGVPLTDAIRMASLAPAQMLGIADRLGSLAVGKQANLLALTTELNQQHIWVAGREIDPAHFDPLFSGSRVNQDVQESLCI